MLTIDIPGFRTLVLEHLVLDFNGVLALDGKLLDGLHERLKKLSENLTVHVVTADTFGSARKALEDVKATLTVLDSTGQDEAKWSYMASLGHEKCVCIGNGRNDRLMLKDAALGIAVIHLEGMATEAALASDVLSTSIHDALDLLLAPKRLVATLRA